MLINRTQRIAVMSVFLSLDYILGLIPFLDLFLPYLDFIMLFVIINLIGWRLGLVWYGMGFIPVIPRLLVGGSASFQLSQLAVQIPHLKNTFTFTMPEPFNSWGNYVGKIAILTFTNMTPLDHYAVLGGIILFMIGYYVSLGWYFYQWTKFFWVRIVPPLGSKIDPKSFAKSQELSKKVRIRNLRRQARKMKLKGFGRFWFFVES